MKFSIKKISTPYNSCEWIDDNSIIFSKGRHLYITDSDIENECSIGSIPLSLWQRLAVKFSLLRRLLRLQFYNVIKVSNGVYFVSFKNDIYLIKNNVISKIDSRNRKSKILRGGACCHNNVIYFGEYFDNSNRDSVNIYSYSILSGKLEVVYELEPRSIRHIHSIRFNKFDNCFYVFCGDIANECKIIKFNNDFTNVSVIGEGSEEYRVIAATFTENGILYATDAEHIINGIYSLEYDKKPKKISDIRGPAFDLFNVKGKGVLFFTVCEGASAQIGSTADIYFLDNITNKVEQLHSLKKDFLPKKYFQFGYYTVPNSSGNINKLYVSTVGLYKGGMYELSFN